MSKPMPALIGHRGLPLLAPENTEASLKCAAKEGITWVEIDVTMAGDESLVIMHDLTLKRFGQPDIALTSMDKSALQQVDAGAWFDKTFTGEPLLFLDGLLEKIQQLKLSMNLEIKINPDLNIERQVGLVLEALKGAALPTDRLVLSSFNLDALKIAQRDCPELKRAILYEAIPDNWHDDVDQLEPVSVHCDQSVLTQPQAEAISNDLPLYCFTVNDTQTFEKLLNWGVSGVFCDRAHAEDMRHIATSFGL